MVVTSSEIVSSDDTLAGVLLEEGSTELLMLARRAEVLRRRFGDCCTLIFFFSGESTGERIIFEVEGRAELESEGIADPLSDFRLLEPFGRRRMFSDELLSEFRLELSEDFLAELAPNLKVRLIIAETIPGPPLADFVAFADRFISERIIACCTLSRFSFRMGVFIESVFFFRLSISFR